VHQRQRRHLGAAAHHRGGLLCAGADVDPIDVEPLLGEEAGAAGDVDGKNWNPSPTEVMVTFCLAAAAAVSAAARLAMPTMTIAAMIGFRPTASSRLASVTHWR